MPTSPLGDFIRAMRARRQPADVGLPVRGSRRTPGLRREELATLAGVSVDYLIRLEQGRDRHPSAAVIVALADALGLDEAERAHLMKLAVVTSSPELCGERPAPVRDVRPSVRAMLDGLEELAAFVLGPYGDVLAVNAAFAKLARPLGFLHGDPPNLARYVFTDPRARQVYPDWDRAADDQARHLRAVYLAWEGEPGFETLMADLHRVEEFEQRWLAHAVRSKRPGPKRLVHPGVGELRLHVEVLALDDSGLQRFVTWVPADDATAAAVARATGGSLPSSPAQLRVVGGGGSA